MSQSPAILRTKTEAPDKDMRAAAHTFAQALAESAEFTAFEKAADRLRQDETAQEVIRSYQEKQQSLGMMLRLNAVSAQERAELARLEEDFYSHPTVAAYLQAQEKLNALFQAASGLLSEKIGLSFTTACGPGCC